MGDAIVYVLLAALGLMAFGIGALIILDPAGVFKNGVLPFLFEDDDDWELW